MIRSRPSWLCETFRVPPPDGSRNAWAHPSTGGSDCSAAPFSEADQPPDGSASTSVPPLRGAATPDTPTGPERTGTTVPSGSMTRAWAVVAATRHSWNDPVLLTGRSAATPFSAAASVPFTGAGSST